MCFHDKIFFGHYSRRLAHVVVTHEFDTWVMDGNMKRTHTTNFLSAVISKESKFTYNTIATLVI